MANDPHTDLSRRRFLEMVAAAGVAAGCSGGSEAGGTGSAGAAGSSGSGGTGGAPTGGAGGEAGGGGSSALVAVVRRATIEEATREAVTMAGGVAFAAGATVLLKPNLNSGDPCPCSPSPEVMSEVIRMCNEAGANRVIVADRCNPSYTTFDCMQRAGWYDLIQTLGAEPMDLLDMPTRLVTPPGATHWPNGFNMYEIFFDGTVDHVINMCCCKDHTMANYTMAMKAWMGIITQDARNTAHGDLGNRLPELHLALRERLTVMDASKCNLTGGPWPGEQADSNVIVASQDPVANDATGVAILKYWLAQRGITNDLLDATGVWDQPQLVRAMAIGLGIGSPAEYSYEARGVTEIADIAQYLGA